MSNKLPRGLRNNNPGNIRLGSSAWTGKVPNHFNTDGEFEQFDHMEYGVRAMVKLLYKYTQTQRGDTLRDIINTYAPPSENHTYAYVDAVSEKADIPADIPTKEWFFKEGVLLDLVNAMIYQENGKYISKQTIEKGIELSKVLENA